MSDPRALRDDADRLGLYFEDSDLDRIATLLDQTRESVRALGRQPTEWIEPGYVFTPTPAASRDADPAG
ncbi:MAG: hypothetical protein ABIR11_00320 [Candidatus Limnocylindrales bacterium]